MKTVIELSGRQYRVAPGDLLSVDSTFKKVGSKVHPEKVLFHAKGDSLLVGEKETKDVKVTLAVKETFRDRKISVRRYKSKSRYRRSNGHRQNKAKLEVVEIKD